MESLNPIELNEIPQICSLVTLGVSIYEVYYVDLQIIQFLMEKKPKKTNKLYTVQGGPLYKVRNRTL